MKQKYLRCWFLLPILAVLAVSQAGTALPATLLGGPAKALTVSAPSIDQSLDMRTVELPAISPDGSRVIYEQSRTNWKDNAFETDLWIADVKSGERRLLTPPEKSSMSAAWSKDGRWIAFLSDRPAQIKGTPENTVQLYVMPSHGGDAWQLTAIEKGIKSFDWSPNGRSIAFTAEGPDSKAKRARVDSFGNYRIAGSDYGLVRLWKVALPIPDGSGAPPERSPPKLLTPGDTFSVGTLAYSPDGELIAFSASPDSRPLPQVSNIYTIAEGGGEAKVVASGDGPKNQPRWSPDGSQIAYLSQEGSVFYAQRKIAVVGRNGADPHIINSAFDENAAMIIKWSPEGIYFQALQRTNIGLFLADPATLATRPVKLANVAPGWADRPLAWPVFSLSSDSRQIAFLGGGANHFPDFYVVGASQRIAKKLTNQGDQIAAFASARREAVQWKSTDGTPIEGVLYKPRDFDPKKAYPLLVVIHGGPTGDETQMIVPDREYPVERFVAKGALVLKPNYRGSVGYGEKFEALSVGGWGVGDYGDVISGVDALIDQGIVDKSRVGVMGWSQGGYISAFIATSSNRFKAVSIGAGLTDLVTHYLNTDIPQIMRDYFLGTPWNVPENYRKASPISYIANAKTPTLIQQGSEDKRIPVTNAYELRQALEDHKVPVKLVVYEGFGHLVDKPKEQRAVMEENEAWFGHYIWGEPLAADLEPRPAKLQGQEPH